MAPPALQGVSPPCPTTREAAGTTPTHALPEVGTAPCLLLHGDEITCTVVNLILKTMLGVHVSTHLRRKTKAAVGLSPHAGHITRAHSSPNRWSNSFAPASRCTRVVS